MKLTLVALLTLTVACSGGSTDVGADDAGPSADDAGPAQPTDASTNEAATPDAGTTNPACAGGYPKGPYGVGVGQVLSPNLSWSGYAANQTTVSKLTSADLWDCDGKKGIDALVLDTSAGWCAACETQAHDEAQLTAQYDQLGVVAITLLIMDAAEQPATTSTALDWRTTYQLDDVGIFADPAFQLEPQNQQTIGLPLTMVVDPRTMKVVKATEGYGSQYPVEIDPTVAALANKNHS